MLNVVTGDAQNSTYDYVAELVDPRQITPLVFFQECKF